eukprot:TRINITY_DN3080_c1_g2_i1.p1 TRINITY_DN3080_c1_g2~~TRINITY_DN3080_c1_g2_i1.p1  ORF type:complete len:187 (+),score=35.76 TRINITY_DN3080_c1_g2_i1:32-562(+)
MAGRWMPGTLTNQITTKYLEPRLLIVTDPRTDAQAVKEASFASIPVIALCDTDSPLEHVDIAVPANNKGKESIALLYWMLAREVQYLRGTLFRSNPWEVMVDSFFWRDVEELERQEAADQDYSQFQQPASDWTGGAAVKDWADEAPGEESWDAQMGGEGADWSAPQVGATDGSANW